VVNLEIYESLMALKGTGYGGVQWIHLAQNRGQEQTFVNTVTNLRVS
jgi:hypothetical protein